MFTRFPFNKGLYKEKFSKFYSLATWGEQCEYCENYSRHFVFINDPVYFKSPEDYG